MGTSNFYNKNASKIWCVETSYYDEEIEEEIEDEFLWEDTRNNVSSSLEKIAKQKMRPARNIAGLIFLFKTLIFNISHVFIKITQ